MAERKRAAAEIQELRARNAVVMHSLREREVEIPADGRGQKSRER